MTNTIDELAETDLSNFHESKRAVSSIHKGALPAAEECGRLLQEIATEFGRVCDYDRYSKILNDFLVSQPGGAKEKVQFLEEATLIGVVPGSDPIREAQEALHQGFSVIARTYLLLRLRRDFFFGISELLRLRLTPSLGYLRLQMETTAILMLIGEDPQIAKDWLNTSNSNEGREFYRRHHKSVVQKLKNSDLYYYYEQGSYMALHSRVFGVGPGVLIAGKDSPENTIGLTYQELDEPVLLYLWFCIYLRAHENILATLPSAVPEVSFTGIGVGDFKKRVQDQWATLRPLYLKMRDQGLPEILKGSSKQT